MVKSGDYGDFSTSPGRPPAIAESGKIELYNADVRPAQILTLAAGVAISVLLWRVGPQSMRLVVTLLGLSWAWIAWEFHWQRYATINWAARWMAVVFAIEALLLLVVGIGRRLAPVPGHGERRRAIGVAAPIRDKATLAQAYSVHDGCCSVLGRVEEARFGDRAIALFTELGDLCGQGNAHVNVGLLAIMHGRWDEGLAHWEQSQTALRRAAEIRRKISLV